MTIDIYLANVTKRYILGNATEHTFRGDLQQLIESIVPDVSATNEPKRQAVGAPDYILTRKDIPVGFIEAKDIGDKDLYGKKKTGNKEQFDRYKNGLSNLIFTDYIDFHFYRDGEFITKVAIAEINNNSIVPLPEHFTTFTNLLQSFCVHIGQTIKSPQKLAKMMAGKARLLADVIEKAVTTDEVCYENSTLRDQKDAFKEILIHDITPKGFADVYAQTIAYGMFAARLNDYSLNTFSRHEAAELIPKSNPFLRKLFGYIAGPDIDDRIRWIVEDLADIFLACNVDEILTNYGRATRMEDPIIHFYETFLSEYDPKVRQARGVWYTPAPVVGFIVRAVDEVLKTEFDLRRGLADTSKTKIKVNLQKTDKRYKDNIKTIEQEVHSVQILDPATGTGTFLAEIVKHIRKSFKGQEGIWSTYVENQLLPRLNGFELLMASYAMAHLQMDLLLSSTGFKQTSNQRLKIYLTNSLEESHPDTGTLFANWLSSEANEANYIKRDTPVMCIIGNPPYNGESPNKGDWIMKLMEDYKKEPGGKEKLKEKNSKFINDDYVKFLRYGQHFIEKNGAGVLAFINPHGYLDNPTYRGMRWSLLKTYDKIYTIDLHGNAKKKETAPDGSPDVNVFDIEQGVSINIFVKTGIKKQNELGKVYHYDLYGKRDLKYTFLNENSLKTIAFKELTPFQPSYIFKELCEAELIEYNKGINPIQLFKVNVMGFQTHRDHFAVDFQKTAIESRARDLLSSHLTDQDIYKKYSLSDNRDWKLSVARNQIKADSNWEKKIVSCGYRPFDNRPCYFSYVMMDYPRREMIQNVFERENILLGIGRQGLAIGDIEWCLTTVSKNPVDANIFRRGGVNLFPLYLYPEVSGQTSTDSNRERVPNLDMKIIFTMEEKLKLTFTNEKDNAKSTFAPIDILDYIYAILHSRNYRKKYNNFLKTDFPRIPFPSNQSTFWQLVELGGKIRQIHLMESEVVEDYITQYPIIGDNIITRKMSKTSIGFEMTCSKKKVGKVWINDHQYFDQVPETAWNFYVGGYQPAQKWLKDRCGRKLEIEDIYHYQKVIVALIETDKLMEEIDRVDALSIVCQVDN